MNAREARRIALRKCARAIAHHVDAPDLLWVDGDGVENDADADRVVRQMQLVADRLTERAKPEGA